MFVDEEEAMHDSTMLPDNPCAIDSGYGLSFCLDHSTKKVIASNATMIICYSELRNDLTKISLKDKRIILSDDPLLTFCHLAHKHYGEKHQPRGRWKRNPDGTFPINTIIRDGAVIYDNVWIGDNCVFGANCVIGDAGFGFATEKNGQYLSMPHFGGVRIGNNVDIGPGCIIDCGTFGDTIIEDNVRIDNLSQIAHNVIVGAGTRIMASVSISGSVTIGRNCWLAPKTMIRNGQKLGDNVLTGCSSMVTVDIPDNHRYQPNYRELHRCCADEIIQPEK